MTHNPATAPVDPAERAATTMTAVVREEYGEAGDVLRVERIARPQIGPKEVLVRVRAAGLDRGVWHVVAGLPYPIRLAGFGVRRPKNPVPGSDLAGVVEAVGPEVTTLEPGDEVFGTGAGSYAEYARASAAKLAPKPASLGFEQAAAVPVSGTTALQALRDHGRVAPGQDVLVIGASGGVGTYAVQIAKAFGAHVTAVCSTGKLDLVRSLGADRVVDYTVEDPTAGDRRYDVVLDIGGNRPLRRLRRVLAPRGRLIIVGGETGGRWLGGVQRQLRAMALSPFTRQKLGTFIASENASDLVVLTGLIESGQVRPVIDRTLPLAEAAAIDHMQAGRVRGKTVLTV
jgi:NADPH:quinone reductase-like Zn-dependent oxidoreductase